MKLGLTKAPASNEQDESIIKPVYGTDYAACFDLKADIKGREIKFKYGGLDDSYPMDKYESYMVVGGECTLIPTGFIFDIPAGFRMNIVPRSGLAWKHGVTIMNAPATIDSDYTDETFVIVWNTTDEPFTINHGDRIAQAEINPVYRVELDSLGERDGGFGSTNLQ